MNIDNLIIAYLKKGMLQPEISQRLKEDKVFPNSLSSIEKRIKVIRNQYQARSLFQLGYMISMDSSEDPEENSHPP